MKLKQGQQAQFDVKQLDIHLTPYQPSTHQYIQVTQPCLNTRYIIKQQRKRLGALVLRRCLFKDTYLHEYLFLTGFYLMHFFWRTLDLKGIRAVRANKLYQPPTAVMA